MKVLTGILAFVLPILYFLGMIGVVGSLFFNSVAADLIYTFSMLVAVLSTLMIIATMIWFIIIACRMEGWTKEKKIMWSILLYCFNVFVLPVFWWMCIRKENVYE